MTINIVAEVGINHNGDMSICKELIDVAVDHQGKVLGGQLNVNKSLD